MMEPLTLIQDLIALYGPPGQEDAVRDYLARKVQTLGYAAQTDPKGNLTVTLPGDPKRPAILITAHMDEIALMVTRVEWDGRVRVTEYGGAYAWKWGEGAVDLLTRQSALPAILSFGSIHTNHEASVVQYGREHPMTFKQAFLFTGMSAEALAEAGVRPGVRVVLAKSRRVVTEFGDYIGSYFLDDRADLAVWLMALERLRSDPLGSHGEIVFAATASEEVGGEGARYILNRRPFDICIALEIGPKTPDADFPIDAQPTIWVRDGYAAMESRDGDILTDCCEELGIVPHWQYLSRGGSDASCSATLGLTARPVTLAFPVENSHGYEIMHRDAPALLRNLLLAYLQKVA